MSSKSSSPVPSGDQNSHSRARPGRTRPMGFNFQRSAGSFTDREALVKGIFWKESKLPTNKDLDNIGEVSGMK
ncbi:unnamed protein product, partial [Allacma fusca]